MRTIDRHRLAAVLAAASAAGLVALAAAAPAGAQEPPPSPGEPSTTVPVTTIPDDTGTTVTVPDTTPTSATPPTSHAPTSTPTDDDGPATTGRPPGDPTTTTTPAAPPSADLACEGPWPSEYTFLVDESIEEGESFADPASDFSATFTQVDFVEDHLVVTFEASHPVASLDLGGLDGVSQTGFFYDEPEPVVVRTVELAPAFGRSVLWAAFCFVDAEAIGAEPPVSPTVPGPTVPAGGDVPVTATVLAPVLEADEAVEAAAPDDGGKLPETGSDVLPLALAGAGLASVGGGLLLGRRMRRPAT